MKNLIDNTKYTIIDAVALKQTRYLKKYYAYSQVNGIKEEVSCTYLKRLVAGEEEGLPDRIITLFSELGRVHLTGISDVQTIVTTPVHISQFVWGRLCVAAYFFYHDEPIWQQAVFDKLENCLSVAELKQDVQTAKALIDEYYKAKLVPPTAEKVVNKSAAQIKKTEDVFSIPYQRTSDYPLLINFLNAEKKDCKDGEWARYALAIYRHKKVFQKRPTTFKNWLPVFCAMFGRDVNYQEPNKLDRVKNEKDIELYLP